MESTIKVPVSSLTNRVTVNVEITGLASFRLRVWIATGLMRLAAWVAGMNCSIEER